MSLRKITESEMTGFAKPNVAPSGLESLESRQLLSGSGLQDVLTGTAPMTLAGTPNKIHLSAAPVAVQGGLTQLASDDGLASPAATQAVKLGNPNGMESSSVTQSGAGVSTRLTVDQNGKAVTQTSRMTTTWDAFNATAAHSAAATEITAIASSLSLTAPTSSTPVTAIGTPAGGTNFVVTLASSDSSGNTSGRHRGARNVTISVDGTGNPVGNQRLPFSVIPTAIQTALTANVPAGATAPTDTAPTSATAFTDISVVNVHTVDGVTLYSATVNSPGMNTTITVNAAGALTSLPIHTTTTFGELSSAAQTELQTLSTQYGAPAMIDASQKIDVLTEANGTGLYSLTAKVSSTDANGAVHANNVVMTVDTAGNPTTPPKQSAGFKIREKSRGRPESKVTEKSNVTAHFATKAAFAGLDAKGTMKGQGFVNKSPRSVV